MNKEFISEELKKYREENKKTQIDMAKYFEVALSTYQMWEKGVATPNEKNLPHVIDIIE
jgi:DNA-binding XRE family transcriptional regulator